MAFLETQSFFVFIIKYIFLINWFSSHWIFITKNLWTARGLCQHTKKVYFNMLQIIKSWSYFFSQHKNLFLYSIPVAAFCGIRAYSKLNVDTLGDHMWRTTLQKMLKRLSGSFSALYRGRWQLFQSWMCSRSASCATSHMHIRYSNLRNRFKSIFWVKLDRIVIAEC